MNEIGITLNGAQELGEFLAEAGVSKVRIIPSAYIPFSETITIYTSFEMEQRLEAVLKHRFRFIEAPSE